MATARLRKTFKYPEDEDADTDERPEMDEEEQAALLSRLRDQNLMSNETFYPILLALPIICTLPFFYILFIGPSSTTPPTYRLLALLSITSLFATSYHHGYISPLSPYNPQNLSKKSSTQTRPSQVFGSSSSTTSSTSSQDGPLNAYLPLLTRILAGVTALSGLFLFFRGSSSSLDTTAKVSLEEHFWLWCFAPAIILASLEVSTRAMADVEKGLEGLRERQYDLKGA